MKGEESAPHPASGEVAPPPSFLLFPSYQPEEQRKDEPPV